MRRNTPLDKIVEAATQSIADDLQWRHDDSGTDSPIEAILLTAIVAEVRYCGRGLRHSYDDLFMKGDYLDEAWLVQPPSGRVLLFIDTQVEIGKYRADFVVYASHGNDFKKLVVECDGHDFHERTKEQAAKDRSRDRIMQEQGYTVFRFTGSEIYRDPMKCAAQVVSWADKATFA